MRTLDELDMELVTHEAAFVACGEPEGRTFTSEFRHLIAIARAAHRRMHSAQPFVDETRLQECVLRAEIAGLFGGDQLSQENIERLLSREEIGGEQLDPGKAIQDVHEPPNCAICGSEAEATCVRDKKGGYSVLRVRCSNPECAESGHQHTPGNWNDEAGGSLCPECGSRPSTQTDVEWEEKVIRRSCSNKSCVNHRPWLDAASWNRLQKKEGGV